MHYYIVSISYHIFNTICLWNFVFRFLLLSLQLLLVTCSRWLKQSTGSESLFLRQFYHCFNRYEKSYIFSFCLCVNGNIVSLIRPLLMLENRIYLNFINCRLVFCSPLGVRLRPCGPWSLNSLAKIGARAQLSISHFILGPNYTTRF